MVSDLVPDDTPVTRRSPRHSRRTRTSWVIGLLVALTLVGLVSLAVGSNPIGPRQVLDGLLGRGAEETAIVRGGRLPRVCLGLLVGAALGVAGMVVQSVTRNPLGDPGILGINAGASAAVVSAISLFGITRPGGYLWFALLGALVASVLVYLLGTTGHGAATPVRLALAGTAVSAALYAYVSGVMITDPWAYNSFRFWDIGSLTGRSPGEVAPALGLVAVGLVGALALARSLDALALGDDSGRSLGSNPGLTRLGSAAVTAALCGGATAAVGPIAFVGLAVPHLARALVGVDHRWLVPTAALLGALVLTSADVVGRVIAWPQETGVGIITAVVGAPVLVHLVRTRRVGRL